MEGGMEGGRYGGREGGIRKSHHRRFETLCICPSALGIAFPF
jgi:hypothetical protein